MALRASGRIAGQADLSAGTGGGGITQAATPTPGVGAGAGAVAWAGARDANFWTWAIFIGAVAYLAGAYIMLGRYRVPL